MKIEITKRDVVSKRKYFTVYKDIIDNKIGGKTSVNKALI